MRARTWLGAALAAAGVFAGSAHAQTDGTLAKIEQTGVITLGVRESAIPFSYYDNNQNVIGYSQDIALRIVDAVKAKLNLPGLKVKLIPITPQDRIPLVLNGTIDLECSSTTHNVERSKQVGFSDTIFVIGTRLLTKKDSGIKGFDDLHGKAIVTNAGSTSEVLLRRLDQQRDLNLRIISQKDVAESFLTLSTGRADAFMLDDALLAGERAKSSDPDDYEIVGVPQSKEAYGCMMRKDLAFKQVADATIARLQRSGEAGKLYKKWFESPIPPAGLDLKLPESPDIKALFSAPNDKPLS